MNRHQQIRFNMLQLLYSVFFKNFVAGLGVALLLVACSPREDVPRQFPDEDQMAEILADIYITESIITHGRGGSGSSSSDEEVPGYYKKVLDDHNLTSQQFDTIRKWYAAHPYHYQRVYEKTVVLLSRKEAELNRQIKADTSQLDTIPVINDLWAYQREIAVSPEDTTDRRLPFQIDVDSLEKGEIRLSAVYKFLREDLTRDGQITMITLYADSTSDTISQNLEKTFKEKSVSLLHPLDSVSLVTNISGYLFEHDTTTVTAIEFSEIQLEHFREDDYDPAPALEKDVLPQLERSDANAR